MVEAHDQEKGQLGLLLESAAYVEPEAQSCFGCLTVWPPDGAHGGACRALSQPSSPWALVGRAFWTGKTLQGQGLARLCRHLGSPSAWRPWFVEVPVLGGNLVS